MTKNQCGSCHHFKLDKPTSERGQCYRHPPLPPGLGVTTRPDVFKSTPGCGEWTINHEATPSMDKVALPTAAEVKAAVADLGIKVDRTPGRELRGGKRGR